MKSSGIGKSISMKLAVAFLVPGILSLIFSILYESQISALVGLGLTFWGALFFLLRPVKYVEGSLLYSSALPSYLTIDRIIKELEYNGTGYYIPAYPKDVYLPQHLKSLKDQVVFISMENEDKLPSIEEMAEGKFLPKNPKGVILVSPGAGLLSQIEKRLNVDFAKTQLDQLCEILPHSVSEDFNLAETVAINLEANTVQLRIHNSLYKNLYSSENDLKSVRILGCPLVSAVACAVAKASGKPVTIEKQKTSPDGLAILVWIKIVEV